MTNILREQAIKDALTIVPIMMKSRFDSVNNFCSFNGNGHVRIGYYTLRLQDVSESSAFDQACYASVMDKSVKQEVLLLRVDKIDNDKYREALSWLVNLFPERTLEGHRGENGYLLMPGWMDGNMNDMARFLIAIRNMSEMHDYLAAHFFHDAGFSKEMSLNLAMIFRFKSEKLHWNGGGHCAFSCYGQSINWGKVKERLLKGGFLRDNPTPGGAYSNIYHWRLRNADEQYGGEFTEIKDCYKTAPGPFGGEIRVIDTQKAIEFLKKELIQ